VPAEPDAVEIRVVACLVEKQRKTPDVYPLSLNAIRLACNQSTNRDPVVDYDEATVSDALRRTALRGWTRLTSGAGSRARKYRHLLPEALNVDSGELAVLAVLMLRGPQTPGELKQRTERLEGFADLGAVNEVLDRLMARGFVIRHPRRPGQKEDRFEQVLGGDDAVELVPDPGVSDERRSTSVNPSAERSTSVSDGLTQVDRDPEDLTEVDRAPSVEEETARLDRLEADLLDLKGEIARLREALGD
jgi:uncharacterized protein YceH (UPF0502 family)